MDNQELEHLIKTAIPNWETEPEKFEKLLEGLQKNDVSTYSDLTEEILPKEDLLPYASKVWINKLYIAAQIKINSSKSTVPATPNEEPTEKTNPVAARTTANFENFQLKWDDIGQTDLLSVVPLSKANKITITHLVVDQILKELGDGPKSSDFWKIVADQMAEKNISFCKKINESYARRALGDCVLRIKNRFDYCTRGLKLDKTNKLPSKHLKMSVKHGCKEWSVDELPEGEDETSIELKRQDLEITYNEISENQWDMGAIRTKMTAVLYGSLRECINDEKDQASEVTRKYPFLKVPDIFLQHYQRLTKTDAQLQITKFIAEKMDTHVEFFTKFSQKHKETATLQALMHRDFTVTDERRFLLTIHMITHYMNEEKYFDQMVLCVKNENATDTDVESLENLPNTPIIVSLGDPVWTANSFFITVDKSVITRVDNLATAFALYFASYFVFNAEYANNLNSTLDYIERFIMGITPNDSSTSKMSSKRKQKVRVATLNDEIDSYSNLIKRRRTV